MIMRHLARTLLALLVITALGCGGGGGGGGTTPPANPTKATLTLSIANLPTGTLVGGVSFNINLAPGVSPAVLNGTDASGSVTSLAGGTNAISLVDFTPSPTSPQITFGTVNLNGFGAGNFMTVNCVISPGTTVSTSGFSVSNIQLVDTLASPIPSPATVSLSVILS